MKAGDVIIVPEHIAIDAPSAGAVEAIWNQVAAHGGTKIYEDEHPHADGRESTHLDFRRAVGRTACRWYAA
jgi:hypothetical protein